MAVATITPSLTPRSGTPQQRQSQTQPPPIPPRATPTTMNADEEAMTRSRAGSIKSQAPPPLPRRGSPAPARLSTSPNSGNPNSTLPMAIRREPPPPPSSKTAATPSSINTQPAQDTFRPSSSTIEEIQRRRTLGSPTKTEGGSVKMPPPVVPRAKMPVDTDSPPPEGLISPVQPDQKVSAPSLPARKPTLPTSTNITTDTKAPPSVASRKPVPTFGNEPSRPMNINPTTRSAPGPPQAGPAQKTGSVADRLKQWEQIGAQSPAAPRVVVPRSPTKPSSIFPPSPIKRQSDDGVKERHVPPTKPVKPETLRKVSNTNGSSPPRP
jgi:hypothetical protein